MPSVTASSVPSMLLIVWSTHYICWRLFYSTLARNKSVNTKIGKTTLGDTDAMLIIARLEYADLSVVTNCRMTGSSREFFYTKLPLKIHLQCMHAKAYALIYIFDIPGRFCCQFASQFSSLFTGTTLIDPLQRISTGFVKLLEEKVAPEVLSRRGM